MNPINLKFPTQSASSHRDGGTYQPRLCNTSLSSLSTTVPSYSGLILILSYGSGLLWNLESGMWIGTRYGLVDSRWTGSLPLAHYWVRLVALGGVGCLACLCRCGFPLQMMCVESGLQVEGDGCWWMRGTARCPGRNVQCSLREGLPRFGGGTKHYCQGGRLAGQGDLDRVVDGNSRFIMETP